MQQKRISNNFRSPFSLASQQQLSFAVPFGVTASQFLTPRVSFSDLIPYDDMPTDGYLRAVENLSGSFKQRIAVVTPPFHRRRSDECHSSGMAFGARRWLAVLQCQCKSYGPKYIRHWSDTITRSTNKLDEYSSNDGKDVLSSHHWLVWAFMDSAF